MSLQAVKSEASSIKQTSVAVAMQDFKHWMQAHVRVPMVYFQGGRVLRSVALMTCTYRMPPSSQCASPLSRWP